MRGPGRHLGGWFLLAFAAVVPAPLVSAAEPAFRIEPEAARILGEYCTDCHEDGTEKGGIRLDNLGELKLDARLDLMNRMQEQVYLKQMPPKKKTQPSEEEREALVGWLWKELHTHNASKLEDKLRYPSYGNYVDHGKLFSGKSDVPAYTPARRWLVSPQIFDQRVSDIFGLEGAERLRPLPGVTNPFILPDTSGVRDYDIGLLDGGSRSRSLRSRPEAHPRARQEFHLCRSGPEMNRKSGGHRPGIKQP